MSPRRSKPVTAAELMARIDSDPQLRAQHEAKERRLLKREAASREEERELLAALRDVGVTVDSVWDLVNRGNDYAHALPVLFEHLQKPYSSRQRDGIARAMAVSESRGMWDVFERLFRAESSFDARQGLAVALANSFTPERLPQLMDLLRDPQQGDDRLLLIGALRSDFEGRNEVLRELAKDPALGTEARRLLKRRPRPNL